MNGERQQHQQFLLLWKNQPSHHSPSIPSPQSDGEGAWSTYTAPKEVLGRCETEIVRSGDIRRYMPTVISAIFMSAIFFERNFPNLLFRYERNFLWAQFFRAHNFYARNIFEHTIFMSTIFSSTLFWAHFFWAHFPSAFIFGRLDFCVHFYFAFWSFLLYLCSLHSSPPSGGCLGRRLHCVLATRTGVFFPFILWSIYMRALSLVAL